MLEQVLKDQYYCMFLSLRKGEGGEDGYCI